MRVSRFTTYTALAALLLITNGIARGAGVNCRAPIAEPFPGHQPYLLNDPRSGLTLHLDSDGRHMSAITRDGKVAWQRNLFDDPRLESGFPQPPQLTGEPPVTDEKWRQQAHAYVGRLYIDRIGIVSECVTLIIDHEYRNPQFRGHYIRAGSGTHIYYLLDAKTGDFLVEEIN